jgi:hypothetical protein
LPIERPSDPAPSGSFSRALLVAGLAAVLYGAILMAVDGFVSLLADRSVISEPDAGPLIGPIMAVVALAIVFVSVLGGLRPTSARPSIPAGRAVVTGVLVYLLSPLAGAIVYVVGQGRLVTGALFFVKYLGSPFVIAAAALAIVAILLLPLIALARSRAR